MDQSQQKKYNDKDNSDSESSQRDGSSLRHPDHTESSSRSGDLSAPHWLQHQTSWQPHEFAADDHDGMPATTDPVGSDAPAATASGAENTDSHAWTNGILQDVDFTTSADKPQDRVVSADRPEAPATAAVTIEERDAQTDAAPASAVPTAATFPHSMTEVVTDRDESWPGLVDAVVRPAPDGSLDFAATLDAVRRVSETLHSAEQRSADLQAGIQALTDRARRELSLSEERVRALTARAEAAEERANQADDRLAQVVELIQREFAAATSAQAEDARPAVQAA
jgi:hypothetical protein